MNILAIESSCDETAAAIVRDGRDILSNVVSSQIDVHQATGGVVPEVAARLQLETIGPVITESLKQAKLDWEAINALAVTSGPGLVGSLLVGVETAKALAYSRNLPLIPVNHLAGHLYACLAQETSWQFPYLGLIVSGGHTELVLMESHRKFTLVGSTRDDAAGEAFDKVGKLLGLSYPAGPEISALAAKGNSQAIAFPRAMLDQANFDFSFSGLKTAVLREISSNSPSKKDVAASFQQAVADALAIKTVRAAGEYKPTAVLLGGGVAANTLLRRTLKNALANLAIPLLATPPVLATDNAAMIGLAAFWQKDRALQDKQVLDLTADPNAPLASPASANVS